MLVSSYNADRDKASQMVCKDGVFYYEYNIVSTASFRLGADWSVKYTLKNDIPKDMAFLLLSLKTMCDENKFHSHSNEINKVLDRYSRLIGGSDD